MAKTFWVVERSDGCKCPDMGYLSPVRVVCQHGSTVREATAADLAEALGLSAELLLSVEQRAWSDFGHWSAENHRDDEEMELARREAMLLAEAARRVRETQEANDV